MECGQPPDAGKGEEPDPAQSLQKGMRSSRCQDFSLARSMLDFYPPKL